VGRLVKLFKNSSGDDFIGVGLGGKVGEIVLKFQ
jgi:hypothetical protein